MLTSYKLIIAVSCVAIITIGALYYVSADYYSTDIISQVEQSANQLSETIKSSTRYDMLTNQRERVHMIMDTVSAQSGIEKIRVFNKEGKIIFSSDKKEIDSMVEKEAEACFACHAVDRPIEKLSIKDRTRIFTSEKGSRNLGIINPIYNEKSCYEASCHAHDSEKTILGVLDVTMSLEKVDSEISGIKMKAVIVAISAVILNSLILWFFVNRLVGNPVQKLIQATTAVAGGDFTHKIELTNNHELTSVAASFNEMTLKLAEAQRKLYHSDKLASLGRLAAGIAHEINNPLTGVLTFASFLHKRAGEDSKMKEDLDVIIRETKRCRAIVKNLLDFSRQVPPQKTIIDISEVINQSLQIIDNQLSIRSIAVKKKFGEERLPKLKGDKNQLQQVLINLIVNAADAIGENARGEIQIDTTATRKDNKNYIQIKIKDSGEGIPREVLSKIFEPFFSTKGQKGTGLGLAVVWGIITEHNGTISVESEEKIGTTFTILLPVDEELQESKG